MEMTDCQATTWLSEAQDLVETLRRLAVNFQQAGARLKSRSRALRGEQRGGESAAALSHLVRQHSATVRNRNSCLRLLKSLRALMDVILGIEPAAAAAEDSWSDDSDHNEANDEAGQVKAEPSVRKTVCVRLGRVRREVALLATRSARLAADESAEERGGGGSDSSSSSSSSAVYSREELLRDEQAALSAATCRPPALSDTPSMRQISHIVGKLRGLEVNHDFQRVLAAAHHQLDRDTEYSRDNFAYGSTPFHSWLRLHTDPASHDLSTAIWRCLAVQSRCPEYVVFGSSLGWLCFYAAFVLGVHAVGFELVAPIVTLAREIAAKHCTPGRHDVRFHCQDMLTARLNRCGVLFLTSRCWDAALARLVHEKIINELPAESVVVDYSANLADVRIAGQGGFDVVGSCAIPVSWDQCQRMHIMRRAAAPSASIDAV